MCTYCSVGGLTFSVEGLEELPRNFLPFVVEKADDLLFRLTVSQAHVLTSSHEEGLELVHVDEFEEDMPRLEIYKKADGWVLLTAMYRTAPVCSRLEADENFAHAQLTVISEQAAVMDFAINNATMLLYAFTALKHKTLELHASVTVKDELGFLFLGKSGTGKSTHSQMWMTAFKDAWLLNDDNPVVRLKDDGVWVYGSPWSGKTPCYKNAGRPVGAFVQLHQAGENTIAQCRPSKAYIYVYGSCSGLKFLADKRDALYEFVSEIVGQVKVWELGCLPNVDAAQLCARTCLS